MRLREDAGQPSQIRSVALLEKPGDDEFGRVGRQPFGILIVRKEALSVGRKPVGHGPNFGSLCVKGRFGFDFIHSPDRLKTPLIKENGSFREASWDEALDLVARKLGDIKAEHGPDSIGMLTSARITNEENYIAQKFSRAVLGTNNVDHCARL